MKNIQVLIQKGKQKIMSYETHACHLNDKVAIFLTPFRLFVKKSGFTLTYVRYRANFIAAMSEMRQMDSQ